MLKLFFEALHGSSKILDDTILQEDRTLVAFHKRLVGLGFIKREGPGSGLFILGFSASFSHASVSSSFEMLLKYFFTNSSLLARFFIGTHCGWQSTSSSISILNIYPRSMFNDFFFCRDFLDPVTSLLLDF